MIEATEAEDRFHVEQSDRAWKWFVRGTYAVLISAELWVLWDWWRDTPSGQETLARWRFKVAEMKKRAEECEGCAKRREMLRRATNRMHWEAQQIVEEADQPSGEP